MERDKVLKMFKDHIYGVLTVDCAYNLDTPTGHSIAGGVTENTKFTDLINKPGVKEKVIRSVMRELNVYDIEGDFFPKFENADTVGKAMDIFLQAPDIQWPLHLNY